MRHLHSVPGWKQINPFSNMADFYSIIACLLAHLTLTSLGFQRNGNTQETYSFTEEKKNTNGYLSPVNLL